MLGKNFLSGNWRRILLGHFLAFRKILIPIFLRRVFAPVFKRRKSWWWLILYFWAPFFSLFNFLSQFLDLAFNFDLSLKQSSSIIDVRLSWGWFLVLNSFTQTDRDAELFFREFLPLFFPADDVSRQNRFWRWNLIKFQRDALFIRWVTILRPLVKKFFISLPLFIVGSFIQTLAIFQNWNVVETFSLVNFRCRSRHKVEVFLNLIANNFHFFTAVSNCFIENVEVLIEIVIGRFITRCFSAKLLQKFLFIHSIGIMLISPMMRWFEVDSSNKLEWCIQRASRSKVIHSQMSDSGKFFRHEPWRQVERQCWNANILEQNSSQIFGCIAVLHCIEKAITKRHVKCKKSFQRSKESIIELSIPQHMNFLTWNRSESFRHLQDVDFVKVKWLGNVIIQQKVNPRTAFCFVCCLQLLEKFSFQQFLSFKTCSVQAAPQNEVVVVQPLISEVEVGCDVRRDVHVIGDEDVGVLSSWEKVLRSYCAHQVNAYPFTHVAFNQNRLSNFITHSYRESDTHPAKEACPFFRSFLRQIRQTWVVIINLTFSGWLQTLVRIRICIRVDDHSSKLIS